MSLRQALLITFMLRCFVPAPAQTVMERYEHNQRIIRYKDSVRELEKTNAVARLEANYHTADKDKQLLQQQVSIYRQADEIRRKNIMLAAVIALVALLFVSLILLYISIRNRRRIRARQAEARGHLQQIAYLQAMIKGEETERDQLAGSLQYGISVQLATLRTALEQLAQRHSWLGRDLAYAEIMQQMTVVKAELEYMVQNLAPGALKQGQLSAAVSSFCHSLAQSTGLSISFTEDGVPIHFSADTELTLYRVVQELMQNIIKHAGATVISLSFIHTTPKIFEIRIRDNGTGFAQQHKDRGIGLANVEARLSTLKGIMRMSNAATGTEVAIIIPQPL